MIYSIPKIAKPITGRRIAIGDIHGCFSAFEKLLVKIDLKKNDQLFLLGDLIDKGAESKKVVDLTIELIESDYQIFVVKGNHEKAFLTAFSCGFEFFTEYLEKNGADDFLEDLEKYLKFFGSLEYAYDLGDWLACHSEFLINEKSIYRGMRGMFSNVKFDLTAEDILSKKQVIGHYVKTVEEIKLSIKKRNSVISIDSGCVYNLREGLGFLTALDLDSLDLVIHSNRV